MTPGTPSLVGELFNREQEKVTVGHICPNLNLLPVIRTEIWPGQDFHILGQCDLKKGQIDK